MRQEKPEGELKRGWTTGACATAAVKAALMALKRGRFPKSVTILLPKGEQPDFALALAEQGVGWARVGIVKDAGDDPDVTHGAMITARVTPGGRGLRFKAGEGVGLVSKPGLPIAVGEPAINPVPRDMMRREVEALGFRDVEIEISIPGGESLAAKTWNPRLGIVGGLSILGTTGVVNPYSCAAWIASIHRGIDVARACGFEHVAGCTGSTSETAVQKHYGLAREAMLDMGDFAGGVLKYLRANPVPRLTLGGGFGKMVKLAQGHMDLHSGRSQVDFGWLAARVPRPLRNQVLGANSALEVVQLAGPELAQIVAVQARHQAASVAGPDIAVDVMITNRTGEIIAHAR